MTNNCPIRLTVVPQGGLGNRMRVIRSAYALAQARPYIIDVAFAANSECRCSFTDVFRPLDGRLPNFSIRPARWTDAPPSRSNLHVPHIIRKFFYNRQLPAFRPAADSAAQLSQLSRGRVYLSTCYEFFETTMGMNNLFAPSEEVEVLVSEISARFGTYTVGFHIRTTDNTEALKHSPYSLFEAAARKELESRPETQFYIASDSGKVKHDFVRAFGSRVHFAAAPLSRATREGMIAAAADMFTLSRCNKIYGSHFSSFSEIAAEIAGKQAEILRQ